MNILRSFFVKSILSFALLSLPGCRSTIVLETFSFNSNEYLKEAEESTRKGDYESAINAYFNHIESRRTLEDRPEWENPNFYLLLIGDLYLKQGNVDDALRIYEEAEEKGIESTFVSDRYRMVARMFEDKGELKEAIDVLTKYRERDPLLNDLMLDRLSRELIKKENEGK